MTKNVNNYVIMTSLRRQDEILKSNGYHCWISLIISYKILFKNFSHITKKRVKNGKNVILGDFPIFLNKSTIQTILQKHRRLPPFPPLNLCQTKIFLDPWDVLHTTKVVRKLPPPRFFVN